MRKQKHHKNRGLQLKTFSSEQRDVLTLSDLHFGHKGTSVSVMCRNFQAFFGDFKLQENFDQVKLILISGDLWHKSVSFGADIIPEFLELWYKFTAWCFRKGIVLRLLKGTPEHDANQGSTLTSITSRAFPDLDFRYIPSLSVEIHSGLGLSILYVPDVCRPSAEETYQDAVGALHEAGLQKADIGCMHGMFKYQLGNIPMNHNVHDEQQYLELVTGFITVGHIHVMSSYERIYAQGSFDRISHGEESPKGAFYFTEVKPGSWEPVFLVNHNALIYKTIEIKPSAKDPMRAIEELAESLPDGSHLRIAAPEGHDVLKAVEAFSKKYPFLHITRKLVKPKKVKDDPIAQKRQKTLTLNRETLTEAIMQEINLNHDISPEEAAMLYMSLESLHV